MTPAHRVHNADEKLGILREMHLDGIPISEISVREGIHPSEIRAWERKLFEDGAGAFSKDALPSPGLRHDFEAFSNRVCWEAQVDSSRRFETSANIVNHLEQSWAEAFEGGFSEREAAACAFRMFGDEKGAADFLRQPFWKRLLLYDDYRINRLAVCILFALMELIQIDVNRWFEFHLYRATVSMSMGSQMFQIGIICCPLLVFLLRPNVEGPQSRSSSSVSEAGAFRSITPRQWIALLGAAVLPVGVVRTFADVPYYFASSVDWKVTASMIALAWLVTVASVPALACLAAEVLLGTGDRSRLLEHRFLGFVRRCETGRLIRVG